MTATIHHIDATETQSSVLLLPTHSRLATFESKNLGCLIKKF